MPSINQQFLEIIHDKREGLYDCVKGSEIKQSNADPAVKDQLLAHFILESHGLLVEPYADMARHALRPDEILQLCNDSPYPYFVAHVYRALDPFIKNNSIMRSLLERNCMIRYTVNSETSHILFSTLTNPSISPEDKERWLQNFIMESTDPRQVSAPPIFRGPISSSSGRVSTDWSDDEELDKDYRATYK